VLKINVRAKQKTNIWLIAAIIARKNLHGAGKSITFFDVTAFVPPSAATSQILPVERIIDFVPIPIVARNFIRQVRKTFFARIANPRRRSLVCALQMQQDGALSD